MYSFNYDNTDTKQIFENIKPFLTSDSTISEKEIKDLVTDPATSENVSIEYSSFSIDKESNKKIDDKNVDSNLVYIDVVVRPNDKNNEYTKKQEMTINLKQENNKLKVYNVEYLADNDLFKN